MSIPSTPVLNSIISNPLRIFPFPRTTHLLLQTESAPRCHRPPFCSPWKRAKSSTPNVSRFCCTPGPATYNTCGYTATLVVSFRFAAVPSSNALLNIEKYIDIQVWLHNFPIFRSVSAFPTWTVYRVASRPGSRWECCNHQMPAYRRLRLRFPTPASVIVRKRWKFCTWCRRKCFATGPWQTSSVGLCS